MCQIRFRLQCFRFFRIIRLARSLKVNGLSLREELRQTRKGGFQLELLKGGKVSPLKTFSKELIRPVQLIIEIHNLWERSRIELKERFFRHLTEINQVSFFSKKCFFLKIWFENSFFFVKFIFFEKFIFFLKNSFFFEKFKQKIEFYKKMNFSKKKNEFFKNFQKKKKKIF